MLTSEVMAEGSESLSQKKRDAAEWTRTVNRLNQLEAQMREDRGALQSLIDLKKRRKAAKVPISGAADGRDLLEEIVQAHKTYQDSVDRYNSERRNLKYRFPGEGDIIERRYMVIQEKSVEEVGREIGVDGDLTHLTRIIEQHYKAFVEEEAGTASPNARPTIRRPASGKEDDGPERMRIVR